MIIHVIHGPNLNLLGLREPALYGRHSLEEIDALIRQEAEALEAQIVIKQLNREGDIVRAIHDAHAEGADAIVINPAGYTHTSVVIRDAIEAVRLPTVEVHLSNIQAREDFRKTTLTGEVCVGQVSGFGAHSYVLGLRGAVHLVEKAAGTLYVNR